MTTQNKNIAQPVKMAFNPDGQSELSRERIEEINTLCYQTSLKAGLRNNEVQWNDLMCENYYMQEVLERVTEFSQSPDFYRNVDWAFSTLMEQRPSHDTKSIFSTYQTLTELFRVLEKHQGILNEKYHESCELEKDLNTLDGEERGIKKGESNNG